MGIFWIETPLELEKSKGILGVTSLEAWKSDNQVIEHNKKFASYKPVETEVPGTIQS